jgi:hypothetical protein
MSLLVGMDPLIDKILELLKQLRTNLNDSDTLDRFKTNFEHFIRTYYPTETELNIGYGGSKRKTKKSKRKTKKRKTKKSKRRKTKRRQKKLM